MQTLGTWLQLSGSAITGFGLLYAWLKVSGRLRQWGVAAKSLVVQLRSSLRPRETVKQAGAALVAEGKITAETESSSAVLSMNDCIGSRTKPT
jgi:hypothetical protein